MIVEKKSHSTQSLGYLLGDIVKTKSDHYSIPISSLTNDSRRVLTGSLFFGLPGVNHDGRDFVKSAFDGGASAAIVESFSQGSALTTKPCYHVYNLKSHIGRVASRYFGQPSKLLMTIGVTGTNGKTTCSILISQALSILGRKCGFIGTNGWGFHDNPQESKLTTPDAIELQKRLFELVKHDADSVCLEVSSHALDQGRIEGTDFDLAVFTNLSHDHLDYHGCIENYAQTKLLLFKRAELKKSIINVEDPVGKLFCDSDVSGDLWTYGNDSKADVFPLEQKFLADGLSLILASPLGNISFKAGLFGKYNAKNLIAVATTLLALNCSISEVSYAMSQLKTVEGRFEFCQRFHDKQPSVVIDYAHSPEALKQVISSLRSYAEGKIWCVFGCGGNRDREKRSLMGQCASKFADHVVITNDNPRNEDPEKIISDIMSGVQFSNVTLIPDRAEAIKHAVSHAKPRDVVLIAGKGCEKNQLSGDEVIPFCDKTAAEQALKEMLC